MKRMIFLCLGAVVFLNACAGIQIYREEFYIDPSIRKVVLFNNSPYILKESGIFNREIDPGERAETNIGCYKTVKGLVKAYKRVGKNRSGEKLYEIFGQRWYTIITDGRNVDIDGVDTDGYVKFWESSFSPSQLKNGQAYYVPLTGDPCSAGRIEVINP